MQDETNFHLVPSKKKYIYYILSLSLAKHFYHFWLWKFASENSSLLYSRILDFSTKSEKVCGTAFSVKKKLRVIFGTFWVIPGPFWAFLGHFGSFLGTFRMYALPYSKLKTTRRCLWDVCYHLLWHWCPARSRSSSQLPQDSSQTPRGAFSSLSLIHTDGKARLCPTPFSQSPGSQSLPVIIIMTRIKTWMQSFTRRGTRKPLASFSRTVSRLTPNSWPRGAIVFVDLVVLKKSWHDVDYFCKPFFFNGIVHRDDGDDDEYLL